MTKFTNYDSHVNIIWLLNVNLQQKAIVDIHTCSNYYKLQLTVSLVNPLRVAIIALSVTTSGIVVGLVIELVVVSIGLEKSTAKIDNKNI